MPRTSGFTLLELLIAIAIFGLIGMAAYQMLTSVLRIDSATRAQEQRLRELVRAMGAFERDLRQARARPIRAAYGDPQPSLHGTDVRPTGDVLTLTRGGWRNPTASPRANLQRVRWQVRNGGWERHYWLVLDQAQDSQPQVQRVLEGIRGWRLRYLGGDGWVDSWPRALFFDEEASTELPRAIELQLEHAQYGRLRRVFRLPDAPVAEAAGAGGEPPLPEGFQ